jgi:hypothetical protein
LHQLARLCAALRHTASDWAFDGEFQAYLAITLHTADVRVAQVKQAQILMGCVICRLGALLIGLGLQKFLLGNTVVLGQRLCSLEGFVGIAQRGAALMSADEACAMSGTATV